MHKLFLVPADDVCVFDVVSNGQGHVKLRVWVNGQRSRSFARSEFDGGLYVKQSTYLFSEGTQPIWPSGVVSMQCFSPLLWVRSLM